jgi:TolB-like protein
MSTFFNELKRRNVVRVAVAYLILGWLVFQIAETLLPGFGAPEWIFKTLVLLVAIGFPFAVLFAWAFELTPEGLKKTGEVDVTASVTGSTGKKINAVIITSLVVALVYFVWDRQQLIDAANGVAEPVAAIDEAPNPDADESNAPEPADETTDKRRSIAVLPFVNMSSDAEQEWFADGLTEEILNSLARTPDLLVAARTSSFKFKGSGEDIPTIAESLGVEHVLEGSVRRSGDRLRVTAQLIRANDGFHLWSETFDRTMNDVIEIQEQVAIEIADALETAMDPEALARMVSTGTSSVPAYEAYLQGLAYTGSALVSTDGYQYVSARESFEKAVAADPEFSLAHRQIAAFWNTQMSRTLILTGITELPQDEIAERYYASIEDAIRYEDNPVRQIGYRADKARTELKFLQALRLNTAYLEEMPLDSDAQFLQLGLVRELGDYEEAINVIERYNDLGIYDPLVVDASITTLLDVNRPDLLREYTEHALERLGDNVNILYQAHRALLWVGDIDGASLIMPTILTSDLDDINKSLVMLRQACAEGDSAKAKRIFERGQIDHADSPSTLWLSQTIMSRDDEAVQTLMPFDDAEDFAALADFLGYGRFDATKFPNFHAMLESQGIKPHAGQPVPYACKD